MSEKDAKVWRKLHHLFPPTPQESELAQQLYRNVISPYGLSLSINQMLSLNHSIIFDFYFRLALFTTPGRSYYRKKSTNWFTALNVHRFNLKTEGGLLNLLKIAPLLKGQTIALSNFTLSSTAGKAISHSILDESLADPQLQQHHFSYDDQLKLVFEALQRLKIGIGLEFDALIDEQALAVKKRPDLFKRHQQTLYFDTSNTTALDYLATATVRLAKSHYFDFVLFQLDYPFTNPWQGAINYLVQQSRVRASWAVVVMPLNNEDDLANSSLKTINLKNIPPHRKPFWYYLSNNLQLFRYIDTIEQDNRPLVVKSHLISPTDFEKMTLITLINQNDYGLMIKSNHKYLFIGYFTYSDCPALTIDLYLYGRRGIYLLSHELFCQHHTQLSENELSSEQFLTIPALAKESIACYLIS